MNYFSQILFPIIFLWRVTYYFPVIFINKRFNFCYCLRVYFYFCMIKRLLQHIENIYLFYWMGLLLIFFHPIRRIYIWSTSLKIYFMAPIMNTIKYKITNFNWCFQTNLTPGETWLNNFSIISSASSLNMISMLSFSESITRSSSLPLEKIKLVIIVTWIFRV